MGRPREFDRTEALHKAMEVFWAKGYEATSIQDLVDAMSVNRGSIYASFGDKHTLFLEALDHYSQESVDFRKTLRQWAAESSALEAIENLFVMIARRTGPARMRGCFLCNTAVDSAPHDPEIAVKVANGLKLIEASFYDLLQTAKARGELPSGATPRALARYLTSSFNGLMVMSKAISDDDTLQDIIDVTLAPLR